MKFSRFQTSLKHRREEKKNEQSLQKKMDEIAEVPGKALRLFYGHVHTEKTEFQ